MPLLPGARLDLVGTCNRCGLCCVADHQGQRLVCEHLRAELPVRPLGVPESSRCQVYEQRRSGMTIKMLDGEGITRLVARCYTDTWQEDLVIAERGIGKGCSLHIPVSEGQLVKFEPARR